MLYQSNNITQPTNHPYKQYNTTYKPPLQTTLTNNPHKPPLQKTPTNHLYKQHNTTYKPPPQTTPTNQPHKPPPQTTPTNHPHQLVKLKGDLYSSLNDQHLPLSAFIRTEGCPEKDKEGGLFKKLTLPKLPKFRGRQKKL